MIDARHDRILTCSLTVIKADENKDYTANDKEKSREVEFCSMFLKCFAAMRIEIQEKE